MEEYEKDALTLLLSSLCNDTTAEDEIIIKLQSHKIITEHQADEMRAKLLPYVKKYEIFTTMMKKKGSMLLLLKILRETLNGSIADAIEKEVEDQRIKLLNVPNECGVNSNWTGATVVQTVEIDGPNNVVGAGDVNANGRSSRGRSGDDRRNGNVTQTAKVKGEGNMVAAGDINC